MATILIKISFVSTYQRITLCNKTIIVTMLIIKCSSIKIQGLSKTKMNEREFQGLLKFKGFQDAYEPYLKQNSFLPFIIQAYYIFTTVNWDFWIKERGILHL